MRSSDRGGRTSADDFVERLKSLVTAQIVGSQQLLTRFSNFVQEASKAVSAQPAGQRLDAQALLLRWLDFNLASYAVVANNGLALLNGLLSAAESTLIPKPAPVPAASSAPRIELRLAGRHGERATSGFMLENHFDSPLAVTFECGDLVPRTGSPLPASLVTFEPAKPVIQPHGNAVVNVGVLLTSDFIVGETYTTAVRLYGLEAREVSLSVTVLPSADSGEPVGLAPETGKSAKKQRTRT
jgi:hypothetical protein